MIWNLISFPAHMKIFKIAEPVIYYDRSRVLRIDDWKPGVGVTNTKRLLTKSVEQNAWSLLANAKASANDNQTFY